MRLKIENVGPSFSTTKQQQQTNFTTKQQNNNKTTTNKQQQQQTNFIENWKITNYITFPPANSLWTNRDGGSWRHITKQELYIDGLNNSEDTTIQ